jgi:hypothetical protein
VELLYQDILYENPGCPAADFTELASFSEQCAWSLQDCVCVCVCVCIWVTERLVKQSHTTEPHWNIPKVTSIRPTLTQYISWRKRKYERKWNIYAFTGSKARHLVAVKYTVTAYQENISIPLWCYNLQESLLQLSYHTCTMRYHFTCNVSDIINSVRRNL